MHISKRLVLPLVALTLLIATPAYSQSTDAPPTTTSPSATSTLEETTTTAESTTTPTPSAIPPSALPEGGVNSPCNATHDCQPHKNLECLQGACHCPEPQVFDIRVERCVIPLGKPCDSSDIIGENMCPEFAECFMDRCVCKTGYSMHTLTRCKSDLIEERTERKPIVLWPPPPAAKDELSVCNAETCDASKGLSCQEDKCKCTDSQQIYIEEFGRCLNSTLQKTLKDALSLVATSEDEIKSFVQLLEKIDDVDQETGGSDHYNSPVHQLLGLLGGEEYSNNPSSTSQVAPSSSDLHGAAQEPVTETTVPSGGQNEGTASAAPAPGAGETMSETGNSGSVASNGATVGSAFQSPEGPLSPVSAANAESSTESSEALTYSSESQESVKRPSPAYPSLPLDNLQYSPQSQEPQIVQRQAPPYSQAEGLPFGSEGGLGGNHFRIPFQGGGLGGAGVGPYGAQLGLGGLGGGFGPYGGLGGFGGQHGLGGFGGGLGGHHGGALGGHQGGLGGHHGGALGGHQGGLGGHHGGALGGHQGGLGGHHGGALGGHHGGGLAGPLGGHAGGHAGGHEGGHGGGHLGGHGGGHAGGHGEGGHLGGHGGGPLEKKEGLLIDVAEFVGRSLKLVDRFLPLVHAINDVLKKEGLFDKKEGGLFGLGGLGGGPGILRGRRFGENSKEVEELTKEGGDDTLKKLLE